MVGCLGKGYGDIRFTAKGNGGHVSFPQKQTPLTRLVAFIMDIENHNPFTEKMNSTVAEMFWRMPSFTGGGRRSDEICELTRISSKKASSKD